MATAGTVTVDTTGEYIFRDDDGCTSFQISVPSGSTQDALINVEGLHDSGEFFRVQKGQDVIFRLFDLGIRKVWAKGNGGNATIYYGAVSKT